MKPQDFDDLLASIAEAGAIHRGEKKPSRQFHFEHADIQKTRSPNVS